MSTPRVLTTRRTTLALALAAPLVLASCELDPPSATPSPSPTTAPPMPDAEVVASARTAILTMVASVEGVTSAHPRLSAELSSWLSLHAAHLEVLDDGSEAASVEASPAASTAAVARRRVLSDEARLAGTLADAARDAASGDLARALASMSAGVTQRVMA